MRLKYLSLLLVFTGITLLTGGCQNQETPAEPETIIDFLVPSAAQSETDTIPEPTSILSTEPAAETIPEQTSATEQITEAVSSEIQQTQTVTPEMHKEENNAADELMTVSNEFYASDTWISRISFQMPRDWSYRIDEDPSDWGFWIDIPDQKNFTLHIHALPGTFNVENFYTATPTDFVTTSGVKGKLYQERSVGDDGIPYIEGDIVFDQPSSGISFLAYEDIYDEYMDTLQNIFLSVTIEDIYTE